MDRKNPLESAYLVQRNKISLLYIGAGPYPYAGARRGHAVLA